MAATVNNEPTAAAPLLASNADGATVCGLCGRTMDHKDRGSVSHALMHVRRGEAVEDVRQVGAERRFTIQRSRP